MIDDIATDPSFLQPSRLPLGHIRLLVLDATTTTGEISRELVVRKLSPQLEYHALSYAWNGIAKSRQILINAEHIPVTESVHNALLNLRSIVASSRRKGNGDIDNLPIWIDAVCINQDDTQERNEQVRQMERIYSIATKVLVYLGPVPTGTRNELSFLMSATKELSRARLRNTTTLREMCMDWAIPQLRKRTWFDRVWVLQEVVVSKVAMVICGDYLCRFDELDKALGSIKFEPDRFSARNKALYDLRNVIALFKRLNHARNMKDASKVMVELSNARRLHCTDDHDHIFGLFGLFPPGELPPEGIDYSLSVVEIYIFAAQYTINHSGFSPLSIEHAGDYPCKFAGLPSWVPDWSMPGSPRYYPWDMYSAGGHNNVQPTPDDFSDNGLTLTLRGFQVDLVTSSHHKSQLCSNFGLQQGYHCIEPHLVESNLAGKLPSMIDLEAIRRTCCADLACTDDPKASRGMVYHRWRNMKGKENTVRRLSINSDGARASPRDITAIRDSDDTDVFLIFRNGRIGMGRCYVRRGDIAVVFPRVTMPFILRKRSQSKKYEMIGPAYIHEIMDGEAMDLFQEGKYQLEEFAID